MLTSNTTLTILCKTYKNIDCMFEKNLIEIDTNLDRLEKVNCLFQEDKFILYSLINQTF